MYPATKKTRKINSFIRTSVVSPRDLYAKYGPRFNVKGIRSHDGSQSGTVMPEGASVIESMIAGQRVMDAHRHDDLPD